MKKGHHIEAGGMQTAQTNSRKTKITGLVGQGKTSARLFTETRQMTGTAPEPVWGITPLQVFNALVVALVVWVLLGALKPKKSKVSSEGRKKTGDGNNTRKTAVAR